MSHNFNSKNERGARSGNFFTGCDIYHDISLDLSIFIVQDLGDILTFKVLNIIHLSFTSDFNDIHLYLGLRCVARTSGKRVPGPGRSPRCAAPGAGAKPAQPEVLARTSGRPEASLIDPRGDCKPKHPLHAFTTVQVI